MTDRDLCYSDAMDLLAMLMENAPSTGAMLRLSRLIGLVHDAMHEEANEPAMMETSQ